MKSSKAFAGRPPLRRGMAALALFSVLAAAGCGHSGNPADRDRPAAPPADAITQIQGNAQMSPQEKQEAINAITVARTRATGQMTVQQKQGAGM